jgi:lactate dehydrogenase-like 2-hydroxyacid dehydrogenase
MDVLIVEPLDADVLHWLGARHALQFAPELAQDLTAFRATLAGVRAMIIPPSVPVDASVLQRAPRLRAVGRLSVGAENIDLDACELAGVEVVRPSNASAASEAEFVIGALLQTAAPGAGAQQRRPAGGARAGRHHGGRGRHDAHRQAAGQPAHRLWCPRAGLRPRRARHRFHLGPLGAGARGAARADADLRCGVRAFALLPALHRPLR